MWSGTVNDDKLLIGSVNTCVAASDGFASITQDMGTSGIFGGSAVPGYTNLVYFSWLGLISCI